jgi:hypothetical protein
MMSKKQVLCPLIMLGIVLVSCNSPTKQQVQASNDAASMQKDKLQELKARYQTAKSEQERRNVCLQAIDAKLMRPGEKVSVVQEIANFTFDSVEQRTTDHHGVLLFADQPPRPANLDVRAASGDVGSYLDVRYDSNGIIKDYLLSNLHKGGSRRTDGIVPISVAELRSLYQSADSEIKRRDVAFTAIDEGVIQTFGPVQIATVDSIFGTHFAQDLPSRKEGTRKVAINFASPNSAPESLGWRLVVEYFHDGSISNYYLTNVPQ